VTLPAYDPFSPEVQRDPYPHYAELRREAPVYAIAGRGMWAVSRHPDVGFALKRHDLFSSSIKADRSNHDGLPADEALLSADPPAHTGLRKRVERSFTPRRVRALEGRMRALADELAAAFPARGPVDVVAALAAPLPVIVIAELLGVDPSAHDQFKHWADAVIARGTGRAVAPERRAALDATVAELKAFLGDAIEARRRAPGEDLLSALVRADQGEEAGTGLSPQQALNFAVLLLLGGSETTTNLIGNVLRALFALELVDPGTLDRLRADGALVDAALEETLRYDAPVQAILRRTTQDVLLAGQAIPAGATVMLLLGAANRDSRVFEDADRFRLDRRDVKHLAFGVGPHYCLGATLARLEARAALDALLARRALRPVDAPSAVELVDSFVLRGPRALRVEVGI
jgi:cytochrome P450